MLHALVHDGDRVNGITLGHVMIGAAFVDVIGVQLIVRGMPDDTEDQRRASRIVSFASVASALGLCAIAIFAPIGRMQII